MKFKDWKQKLKEQEFAIPDIYDRIKPYAYRKRVKTESFQINPLSKKKLLFAPLYLLIFLLSLSIFNTDNSNRDHFLVGDQQISYFADVEEISGYLEANREEAYLYQMDYRENKILKAEESLDGQVSEFPKPEITEYLDETTTVAIDDNYLYLITPASFRAFDIEDGYLELAYSKALSSAGGFAEMHVTDDYIIAIYTDHHSGKENIANATKILILDKLFQKVHDYSVSGNYLKSFLINDKLFLFNQISLSNYASGETVPLPEISDNSQPKEIGPNEIAYIKGFGGEAYTIISCLDLKEEISSEDAILLSYKEWERFYFSETGLYLINSHQNTDDKLEYGMYTAVIHYDIKDGIRYSNSVKFKGAPINKSACDEYEGYFRIAISDVDYKITKNFLNTKITPKTFTNRILVLKEKGSKNAKSMDLVNAIDISMNEHLAGVRFEEDKAYALALSGKLHTINLGNPRLPKFESSYHDDNSALFYHPLSEDAAFAIKADSAIAGYKFSFLKLDSVLALPWRNAAFEIKYNDFAYFPVLEAVNNRNAIFVQKIEDRYYLGFAVTNFNRMRGNYYLFEIDTENETCKRVNFEFSDAAYPTRMVASEKNKQIYGISDSMIVVYNYNFEKVGILKIK